ncbi:4Fe-4S binding protein [bacterium]|nr:4Fe-4S binding protein [bacterium]
MSNDSKKFIKGTSHNFTIMIDEEYCKGCKICVDVCPKDTLEMVPMGDRWQGSVVIVRDIETCVGCLLCELQCPDFAIEIDVPKKVKKAAATS